MIIIVDDTNIWMEDFGTESSIDHYVQVFSDALWDGHIEALDIEELDIQEQIPLPLQRNISPRQMPDTRNVSPVRRSMFSKSGYLPQRIRRKIR